MRLAALFAIVIIVLAIAFEMEKPRCTKDSPHGAAIAGVIRIAGCP